MQNKSYCTDKHESCFSNFHGKKRLYPIFGSNSVTYLSLKAPLFLFYFFEELANRNQTIKTRYKIHVHDCTCTCTSVIYLQCKYMYMCILYM